MCEYNVYAQCVLLGMPRSRSIALEGRLMDCCMDCCHGLPLQSFRLLSSELGGQTSAKPLSHGLLRVLIDWFMNNLQKLHFMGIAEAAVQLSSAFF